MKRKIKNGVILPQTGCKFYKDCFTCPFKDCVVSYRELRYAPLRSEEGHEIHMAPQAYHNK